MLSILLHTAKLLDHFPLLVVINQQEGQGSISYFFQNTSTESVLNNCHTLHWKHTLCPFPLLHTKRNRALFSLKTIVTTTIKCTCHPYFIVIGMPMVVLPPAASQPVWVMIKTALKNKQETCQWCQFCSGLTKKVSSEAKNGALVIN